MFAARCVKVSVRESISEMVLLTAGEFGVVVKCDTSEYERGEGCAKQECRELYPVRTIRIG